MSLLIIISVLALALLAVSPAASSSSMELSSSAEVGSFSEQVHAEVSGETENSGAAQLPNEDPEPFQKIRQRVDIVYAAGGIGAAILILFGYLHITSENSGFAKKA